MRIAETFHSIQGEGRLSGVPSFFIRTSGCNLRCRWCDTPYASWNPEGEDRSIEDLIGEVAASGSRHTVLTGGEPMIAKRVHELTRGLRAAGQHITIETAGTIAPEGIACDLASLSPKLSNSTPAQDTIGAEWIRRHEETRSQPEVLRQWCEHSDYQLKFVIATETDLLEAQALVASIGIEVPPEKVLLMPEGTDPDTLSSRSPMLVEACKRHGYRLSPRLHIQWFGNTRGT